MKFHVLRQHYGDQMYMPGDEREAAESDVKHLVDAGVLERAAEKAELAPKNKAEPAAPSNKRDPLDHDGDGRKGGSLPKSQRATKAD